MCSGATCVRLHSCATFSPSGSRHTGMVTYIILSKRKREKEKKGPRTADSFQQRQHSKWSDNNLAKVPFTSYHSQTKIWRKKTLEAGRGAEVRRCGVVCKGVWRRTSALPWYNNNINTLPWESPESRELQLCLRPVTARRKQDPKIDCVNTAERGGTAIYARRRSGWKKRSNGFFLNLTN